MFAVSEDMLSERVELVMWHFDGPWVLVPSTRTRHSCRSSRDRLCAGAVMPIVGLSNERSDAEQVGQQSPRERCESRAIVRAPGMSMHR